MRPRLSKDISLVKFSRISSDQQFYVKLLIDCRQTDRTEKGLVKHRSNLLDGGNYRNSTVINRRHRKEGMMMMMMCNDLMCT